MEKTQYFTSLENPGAVRKTILESSKGIVTVLKQYQTVKSIRKNKVALMISLKDQLKELTFLIDQLNKYLPDKSIEYEHDLMKQAVQKDVKKHVGHAGAVKETGVQGISIVQPSHDLPTSSTPSDMDKLERALASIEAKLKNI